MKKFNSIPGKTSTQRNYQKVGEGPSMETAAEHKSGCTNYQKVVHSFSAWGEIALKKKKNSFSGGQYFHFRSVYLNIAGGKFFLF